MIVNLKQFRYTRQQDPALDERFGAAVAYGQVKLGENVLFWKKGLNWFFLPLDRVGRVFRRVEHVYGKLCCGGRSYDIQSLVLILTDGTELEVLVGDDMKMQAENLYQALQDQHPHLKFGKE